MRKQLGVPLASPADATTLADLRRVTPSYVDPSLPAAFDPRTGLCNVTATNNAAAATALLAANAGTGVFHDVFIGASDMAAYDGSATRSPLSWPEYYRLMLVLLGVASGGTGLLPASDTIGIADSRVVQSGFAVLSGDFAYAGAAGATYQFTPDVGGVFHIVFGNANPAFTIKIGAAAPVTVTPTGAANLGHYASSTSVPAGTPVLITTTGSLTLCLIGTIGTAGYIKHNLARSSMGATTSNDSTNFNNSLLDGAWDPTISPSYYSPAQAAYSGLTACSVTANRVTISLGGNDFPAGKTNSQIIAGIGNVITKFPGATIRLVLPWQLGIITSATWESFGAALYAYATTNGYQLLDWRYQLGNYASMQAKKILGADGYHVTVPAWAAFGRQTALADMAAVGLPGPNVDYVSILQAGAA